MPIRVITRCPKCLNIFEVFGENLQAVETTTKEAWAIECEFCTHLYLYDIQRRDAAIKEERKDG